MNRYIKHTKDQRKFKLASNQQRDASVTNQQKVGSDSFELPQIPNAQKAERVKSGQQRNLANFYLSKSDTNNNEQAAKQRQGRLDRLY